MILRGSLVIFYRLEENVNSSQELEHYKNDYNYVSFYALHI